MYMIDEDNRRLALHAHAHCQKRHFLWSKIKLYLRGMQQYLSFNDIGLVSLD